MSIFIILMLSPYFPHFYYMLGGNQGSLLYGDVSVMLVRLARVVTFFVLFLTEKNIFN